MNTKILKIVLVGLMAGLCYISFMFLQIKIPTPGGFTSFHLGNTFCVLAALLLGGITWWYCRCYWYGNCRFVVSGLCDCSA